MPPVESILIEDPSPVGPVRRKRHRRAGRHSHRARHSERHSRRHGLRIRRVPATPDRVRRRDSARRLQVTAMPEKAASCLTRRRHPLRCLPRALLHQARPRRALRPLRQLATASSFASIPTWCSTAPNRRHFARSLPGSREGLGRQHRRRRRKPSSPPSAPAPPIPTTSPPRSSSPRKSKASTWSRSSPKASSATAASK